MSLKSNHHQTDAGADETAGMHPGREIDITADTCPMTFVRTRLALDRLASGQILAVRLRGEEAMRSVPRAAAEQGHAVLSQTTPQQGIMTLPLRRK